jgi:hypothetical protein
VRGPELLSDAFAYQLRPNQLGETIPEMSATTGAATAEKARPGLPLPLLLCRGGTGHPPSPDAASACAGKSWLIVGLGSAMLLLLLLLLLVEKEDEEEARAAARCSAAAAPAAAPA